MIFDTHCHYNLEPLYGQGATWQSHWQKAQSHGVTSSVAVGTNLETSHIAVSIAKSAAQLSAAIGIHPSEYQENLTEYQRTPALVDQQLDELRKMIHPKVVAVGETGLDYFRLPGDISAAEATKQWQQTGFMAHIKLADELNLPMIIHVRDSGSEAYETVLSLLKAHKKSSLPFILHCISGPLSYVAAAVEQGAYIGMAGNLTYKNAEHLRQIVAAVPHDRLLLETDAPYLPPQEFRGKTSEPWMIALTHDFVTTELGVPDILVENAQRVFSLT